MAFLNNQYFHPIEIVILVCSHFASTQSHSCVYFSLSFPFNVFELNRILLKNRFWWAKWMTCIFFSIDSFSSIKRYAVELIIEMSITQSDWEHDPYTYMIFAKVACINAIICNALSPFMKYTRHFASQIYQYWPKSTNEELVKVRVASSI